MKKRIFIGLLTLWILVNVFQQLKEGAKSYAIMDQAKEYVESLPVDYVHEVKGDCSLQDTFLEELLSLGEWSQENWAILEVPKELRQAWEEMEDWMLYKEEVEKGLISIRKSLEEERRLRLNDIFSGESVAFGIEKAKVLSCMESQRFDGVLKVAELLEQGEGEKAFEEGIKLRWDSNPLPLDIGFMLYPEVLRQGCQEVLQKVIESPMNDETSRKVSKAQEFSNRYGVTIENLEKALLKKASYEYELLPDTPYVGMDLSEVESTKLGRFSKMEHKSQTIDGKTYDYGYIYWMRSGETIFRAYYYGDKIIEASNRGGNRSFSGNSSSRRVGYRGGENSSFDPEDHDIEAYYEDNWDEYEDYEDAYDGFLDEEGEWDDY